MEFAGDVVDVDAATGTELTVGSRVAGLVNPRRESGGAQATYVLAPVVSVVPIPEGLSYPDAATVPMNGLTASLAVEALELHSGAVVLVTGGAGAVGGYAISLARRAGLNVIAEGRDEDVSLLTHLGADLVLPRSRALALAVREVAPRGLDGLIDAANLGQPARSLVRDGGTVVNLRAGAGDERVHHRLVSVTDHSSRTDQLRLLIRLAREGVLKPRVAATLAFEEVAAAHERLARGGVRGRLVVSPDQ
jgi:NADPH:quinone reductase-like Zn-dependent oxidoreductase